MTFTAKVENLEIRGKEQKTGKNGDYLVVRFDDETGARLEFLDRTPERFDEYKRGRFCDVWVKVRTGKDYANFTISEMRYRDGD